MAGEYTVSLREATQILDKKPATVRAYVRSGRLSRQYVDGFNGQEMRLNKEELIALKQSLKDTPTHTGEKNTKKTVKQTDAHTVHDTASMSGDSNVARAIELLEKELENLRKEKDELRHESKEHADKNFQMAGQLGYYQNQVETLKDQVKQLSAPEESKVTKKQGNNGFWSFLSNKR